MEIRLFSTVHVDAAFREYVRQKIARLEKFLPGEGSVDFSVKKEGPQHITELRIHAKGLSLFLKESSPDLNGSTEQLLDKAKNLLRRQHERVIARSHRNSKDTQRS